MLCCWQCEHLSGLKFVRGSYKCNCKQGYEYQFNDRAWYFDGQQMEEEYRKMLVGDKNSRSMMQPICVCFYFLFVHVVFMSCFNLFVEMITNSLIVFVILHLSSVLLDNEQCWSIMYVWGCPSFQPDSSIKRWRIYIFAGDRVPSLPPSQRFQCMLPKLITPHGLPKTLWDSACRPICAACKKCTLRTGLTWSNSRKLVTFKVQN